MSGPSASYELLIDFRLDEAGEISQRILPAEIARFHRNGVRNAFQPACDLRSGTHRMSVRNFTTGKSHSFGGKYLELVPGERLRYTDRFEDPNLPGEMQVTVALKQVSVGTELSIVQEGIPDAIPVEACYLGWQDSLRNLASLVEPEINQ